MLSHEVAHHSREVALAHRDSADRFLVATALVYPVVERFRSRLKAQRVA